MLCVSTSSSPRIVVAPRERKPLSKVAKGVGGRVYGEAHNRRLLLRFRWSPERIALSVAAHPPRGSLLLFPYYYFCLSYDSHFGFWCTSNLGSCDHWPLPICQNTG